MSPEFALVLKLALNDPKTVMQTGYAAYFEQQLELHDAAYAVADAALAQAAAA